MIRRISEIVITLILIIITAPIQVVIFVVLLFDVKSPIFIQERLGLNKKLFKLYKFRTMVIGTESVGTHLVDPKAVTKIGGLLRKSKLDELPQFYNVLLGNMSLVGPRPCIPQEVEIIIERDKRKVFDVVPGITGLTQISGIDMSNPPAHADMDVKMIETMSLYNYIKYLFLTGIGKGYRDGVRKN